MTAEAQINAAIDLLRSHGYSVRAPEDDPRWMRPKRLRQLTGLSSAGLYRRLQAARRYGFLATYGPSGRILQLFVPPRLLAFLSQPKQPGRVLYPPKL